MKNKNEGKTLYGFTQEDFDDSLEEIFTLGFFKNFDGALDEMEKYHSDNNLGDDTARYAVCEVKLIGEYEPQTKLVLSKKKKEDD